MKNGITLIELLMVVAIFLVLFGAASLGIQRHYEYYHFSTEVNELIDDLHYAKQMSITEQKHYAIKFDYVDNGYSVIKYINDSVEKVKSKNFSHGVSIFDIDNYQEAKFTFFGAVFKSGEVKAVKNSDEKIISIKPSGFIHVERIDVN